MKKLIQSLFNRKRVYSSTVRPMDFKYNPIDSNPKKLGLQHNPKVKSVVNPPITAAEWCLKNQIELGKQSYIMYYSKRWMNKN